MWATIRARGKHFATVGRAVMTTAEAGKVYANIGVYILTAGVLTSVLKLDEFAKTPKALVVAFSFISLLLIYYGLYLQANATERKE